MKKIAARCVACGRGFLLDPAFAGSSLPCPSCGAGEGLQVDATTADETEASGDAPASERVVPNATSSTRPPVAATVPARSAKTAAARSEPEEVVCPRCKLHFVPRRGSQEVSGAERSTVLVVEDMEYFRDMAAEALAGNFEVRTAATLAEARALLAGGGIDLMVLDPNLGGGKQGVSLLRELETKPCPIVVFTEQDESEIYGDSWEALQRLGADDIVIKSMNVGESLLRKVSALLGEEPDADE